MPALPQFSASFCRPSPQAASRFPSATPWQTRVLFYSRRGFPDGRALLLRASTPIRSATAFPWQGWITSIPWTTWNRRTSTRLPWEVSTRFAAAPPNFPFRISTRSACISSRRACCRWARRLYLLSIHPSKCTVIAPAFTREAVPPRPMPTWGFRPWRPSALPRYRSGAPTFRSRTRAIDGFYSPLTLHAGVHSTANAFGSQGIVCEAENDGGWKFRLSIGEEYWLFRTIATFRRRSPPIR